MVRNETEIDFVLVGKNNKKYLKDMKAIPWELQHRLVVTDIGKRKIKESNIKAKFQERSKKLVDVDALVCYKLVMKYVKR